MIDFGIVHGRTLALLLWHENSAGEEECVAYRGTARWDGQALRFVHEEGSFNIPEDALERVQPVAPGARAILLDCDFAVSLRVGSLPRGADASGLERIGLRLPP